MIRSTILFFIILWGIGLRAQVFNLGMDKGLSNSSVKCITKDSKGYMWFGTADGLNRYNGYEIRSYRNKLNNIQSLPHNYIYCVTEDKIKNLWIGTGQGVAIYNRNFDSFSRMKFHPHWDINDTQILQADAKTIEVDEQNNVFVGTNGWGMFEKESNKIIADWIPLPINKKEYTYYYHVTGIRNTQNGIILVFINEHGIFIFDKKTKRLIPVNDQVKVANIVTYNNEDQRLYIGNDNGVYVFDTNTRTYVNHITTPSVTSSINCIGLEGKSNLWIGTQNNGVLVWDLQNNKIKEFYNITAKNNNLSSNVIYSLYIDSEKRKWIGTGKGGIDIIDQAKHRFLTENFNISNSSSSSKMFIRSFAEKDTERIWIGSEGDGLLLWNYKEQKFEKTNTAGLPSNNIKSLLKDKNETLWLGADIGILKKVNENFIRYHCYTEKGEENRDFEVLFEDKEGTIWAAAFSNGKLYKYVPAEDKFKLWCPKLIDIMAVSDGPNNSLWAGNYHQLIQIDKKTELFKTFEIGKPVRSIYMDSKNRMWIGTEGKGLLLFNSIKGQIEKTFADDEGLVNNSVLSIQEDADGNLWLSTFSGLTKFNPSKGDFSNYDQSDGLQSNEFSYGASLKLKDGRMAFGGINGFNIFDPKKIKTETRKPPVVITEIRINNTPLNDSIHDATINKEGQLDLLTLPFSQATLSLNFAALEYSSPQRIRYRYKLEGWDKTWNIAGTARSINYNNLNEGNYVLKIEASDSDGKWHGQTTELRIKILPPWYRSWWAYILYVGAIALALNRYLFYRSKQMKLKYEIELTKMGIAQEKELNEKRQAFFTNVSHEFRTPLTLIIDPVKDLLKQHQQGNEHLKLKIIQRNARRLLSLVDQLLFFRKTEENKETLKINQFDFVAFTREIYLCFVHESNTMQIDYTFITQSEPVFVAADKEKIEIILYNLLSNAFKFTPKNGKITLKIEEREHDIIIHIKDTGVGIPKEVGEQIFGKFYSEQRSGVRKRPGFGIGMYLTKSLVEMHGGNITYTSIVNEGTHFIIELPIVIDGTEETLREKLDIESKPIVVPELIASEDDEPENDLVPDQPSIKEQKITEKETLLVVDDDKQIREYLVNLFKSEYNILTATNGEEAFDLVKKEQPEVVVSDVVMGEMNGIELCRRIKTNPKLGHIQVVLLTNSSSDAFKLEGIEEGADDYINKPFDSDVLKARVNTLVKNRKNLQEFFYNAITLKSNDLKISQKDKEFIELCIKVVEDNITAEDFNVKKLALEVGVSHSGLYKKVKTISGKSVNEFIRDIRLRKAAQLFIDTDAKVNEAANQTGFYDIKYFRVQFSKLFGMNPSDYIKKYRKAFQNEFRIKEEGKSD